MSDVQTPFPEAGGPSGTQAEFQLQKIYVKDVSFELPSAPQIFNDEGSAEIKLNISQRVNTIEDSVFEVVLTVTVTATTQDKTAYLAEVHQAGLFSIVGLSDQQRQVALNTLCPHTLFPFAARTITSLVAEGGFPPLVLQPINFDQIYQQRVREAQAQAQAQGQDDSAGQDDMEVQGNA